MLQKRTPGAPLSDAEHKQRQDAARSRWTRYAAAAAAGTGIGGALATSAADHLAAPLIGRAARAAIAARASDIADKGDQLAGILVRRRKAAATLATLARQRAIGRGFTQKAETEPARSLSPVSQRVRLIRRTLLQNGPAREKIETELKANETAWHLSGKQERALRQRLEHLAGQEEPMRMELQHLLGARPPKRDTVAGGTRTRKAEVWEITVKPKTKGTAFSRAKPVTGEAAGRVGHSWEVKPYRARVSQGDISQKGMSRIRDSLKEQAERVHLRVAAHATAMRPTIAARLAGDVADRYASVIGTRLRGRVRLAALGAGALAGAAAGLVGVDITAHHGKIEKSFFAFSAPDGKNFFSEEKKQKTFTPPEVLAKSDDAVTPPRSDVTTGDLPDSTEHLSAAVDRAEPGMAAAIARVFRQWKDDATANLLTPREASLYSTMLTDLDRATRPLEPVLAAGADAPIGAAVPDEDGGHKVVTVTMGARGPDVESFIRDYRQDRIVGLANDQRAAIRDLLLQAAQTGASPDEMARRIRQTIGLTAGQGQQVLNYREELETNDPKALKRVLRDKRFDGVIGKAQEAGEPLNDDQVNRIVDAYHRRALASRAMTIARTEGVGAANNAHVATVRAILAQNPGYTVIKGWNAKLDNRTRHDHVELNGQSVIGLDTPFVCADGEQIRWPHDPKASAKMIVNCRCYPSLRIVPRALAAKMGTDAVRPFNEEISIAG